MLSTVDSSLSQSHPRSAAEVKRPSMCGAAPQGVVGPSPAAGRGGDGGCRGDMAGDSRAWEERVARASWGQGGFPAFDRCC